jgi:phosphoribosyl 1,2-cyclic phosphodiesterase
VDAVHPGSRNRRRNTSALFRVPDPRDPARLRTLNILIDCGKRFWDGAIDLFPALGVRHIDAVVITHGHADAINGLDDLRDFTMNVACDEVWRGGEGVPTELRAGGEGEREREIYCFLYIYIFYSH